MKKIPVTDENNDDPTSSPEVDRPETGPGEGDDPLAGLQADLDRFRDLALRSQASSKGVTPSSLLIRTHAPIPLDSPLLRCLASFEESLQVITRPCCPWDLPDVILRIFLQMPEPLPRRAR